MALAKNARTIFYAGTRPRPFQRPRDGPHARPLHEVDLFATPRPRDFPFDREVMYVRVLFDGAQSVTVEATGQELTSL
jgi:hypothetical protein